MSTEQNFTQSTFHRWGETYDAPPLFYPIQTIASSLDAIPIVDGQFIVTTDTKDLYIDLEHRRLCISDVIQDTEANIKSLFAPLAGKIYFATDTHHLWQSVVKDGEMVWVDLNGVDTIWSPVPYTTTSDGKRGEIAYNGNYLYICVNTNRWKRVALSDWETETYSVSNSEKVVGTSGDYVKDTTAVLCTGTVENYKLTL